jgi:hypothetical protein
MMLRQYVGTDPKDPNWIVILPSVGRTLCYRTFIDMLTEGRSNFYELFKGFSMDCKNNDWSEMFEYFRQYRKSPQFRTLLKYHIKGMQSMFDMADEVMDHSDAIKLRRILAL